MKCPGRDMARRKPQDLFDVSCPFCGARVEFFKDDASRRCPACGRAFSTPRLEPGCAEWCRHAELCRAVRDNIPPAGKRAAGARKTAISDRQSAANNR